MKAVLYSLWKGIITKTEGDIEDDKPKIPGASSSSPYGNFYITWRGGHKSRRTVSTIEGAVYNKCLWLSKENDELARNTFIKYEKNCIKDLETRIEAHKKLIDILEKENAVWPNHTL